MMSGENSNKVPVEIRLANGTVKHLGLLCRESVENVFKKPKADDLNKEIVPETLPQNQSSNEKSDDLKKEIVSNTSPQNQSSYEKSGRLTTSSQWTQCNTILLNKPKVTHRGTTVNIQQKCKCKQVQTPQEFLKSASSTVSTQVEPGCLTMENNIVTTCSTASNLAQAENKTAATLAPASIKVEPDCLSMETETDLTLASATIKVEPDCLSMENETASSKPTGLISKESSHLSMTNETGNVDTSTAVVPVCLYVKTQSSSTMTPKILSTDKSTQCEGESAVAASPLEQALYVLRTVQQLWVFSYEVVQNFCGSHLLVISRKDLLGVYGDGVEPIRVTLDMHSQCTINQLFTPIITKDLAKTEHQLDIGQFIDVLRPLSSTSLILCPGLKDVNLDVKPGAIISMSVPFTRHMSKNCLVWYEKNSTGKIARPICVNCKNRKRDLARCKSKREKKRSLPPSDCSEDQYTPVCKQREQINQLIETLNE